MIRLWCSFLCPLPACPCENEIRTFGQGKDKKEKRSPPDMNLYVGANCPFKMSLTNKNEQKAYVIKEPSCHKKEKNAKVQRFLDPAIL